jgi:hypothetical protein
MEGNRIVYGNFTFSIPFSGIFGLSMKGLQVTWTLMFGFWEMACRIPSSKFLFPIKHQGLDER